MAEALLVGAGGIGCVFDYIKVVDHDTITFSSLTKQFLFHHEVPTGTFFGQVFVKILVKISEESYQTNEDQDNSEDYFTSFNSVTRIPK